MGLSANLQGKYQLKIDQLENGSLCHVCFNDENDDDTITILYSWTVNPGQTVQTKIRLLLEEQSDQGLHCLQLGLYLLKALFYG